MTNFTNKQSERTNKKIGLEIEFYGVHYRTVVSKLKNAGIDCAYESYNHDTRAHWKLVTDVSVNKTDTGAGKGLELVSPPLTIDEMERQLKIVCDVFNEIGAKVDKTCGVHVHHEVDDYTLDNAKNLVNLYFKWEDEMIDQIMPRSRRRHTHTGYCYGIEQRDIERINACSSLSELHGAMGTRYKVLNWQNFVRRGTVEFRQHAGSTDFEKIFNWIIITQSMVTTAKKKKSIKMTIGESVNRTVAFNKEIGIYHTVQGVYVRDRKRELIKKYAKTVTA